MLYFLAALAVAAVIAAMVVVLNRRHNSGARVIPGESGTPKRFVLGHPHQGRNL
ncbi:hypothetical protein [Actinacidiphila glaucinigra]|uniref:Uncharacterized protein n=1 Tax=Actinacidiphila glaucinigra TaxID=235986 RepID=A0A239N7J3_9ACTN|nr:hypothetical protein [Actinacidiphila glaucinigra]SNT50875.1 hypothetical protein SAMN05216252_13258 [Actinacidiphila glaucinigra]